MIRLTVEETNLLSIYNDDTAILGLKSELQ